MDKIFSTRLDESVVVELERVTKRHGMTKKRFLEEAIHARAQQLNAGESSDVWSETCGAWKRKETRLPSNMMDRPRFAALAGLHSTSSFWMSCSPS